MTEIKSHRDLVAWQRAMDAVVRVYGLRRGEQPYRSPPTSLRDMVVLGGQATSIFSRSLRVPSKELETHIEVAERIGFATTAQCREVLAETETVGKLLNGLIRSLSEPKT